MTNYVIVLLFILVLLTSMPLQRLIRRILSSRELTLLQGFWFAAMWGIFFNVHDLSRILGYEIGGAVWLFGPLICICWIAQLSKFDQSPECAEDSRETV